MLKFLKRGGRTLVMTLRHLTVDVEAWSHLQRVLELHQCFAINSIEFHPSQPHLPILCSAEGQEPPRLTILSHLSNQIRPSRHNLTTPQLWLSEVVPLNRHFDFHFIQDIGTSFHVLGTSYCLHDEGKPKTPLTKPKSFPWTCQPQNQLRTNLIP